MAEPAEDELRALGVEDDEDLSALGVVDDEPVRQDFGDAGASVRMPGPESISENEYGPRVALPGERPQDKTRWPDAILSALTGGIIPPRADVKERPERPETLSNWMLPVTQGMSANWADEFLGALKQGRRNFRAIAGEAPPDPLQTEYTAERDTVRAADEQYHAENPKMAFGLNVLGGALVPVPGSTSASFGVRAASTGGMGALAGAGGADEAEDMARGAALGAPLGVAGQALGEVGGDLFGRFLAWAGRGIGNRLGRPIVQASPAARALEAQGVENLTLGQANPESRLAQLEEASTSVGGVGPTIRNMRDAGQRSWQDAVLNQAQAPGAPALNLEDDVAERLAQAYAGFRPAYDAARSARVVPEGIAQLVDAADNPNVVTNAQVRDGVRNFLENQLTVLRPDEAGTVAAGQLLEMRRAIREAIRDTETAAERRLLQTAADDITNMLEAQLPAEAGNALRTADAAYARYKVIEDAVRRSGDQAGGFTPSHLSAASKAATENGAYARGGGGPLRDLARAGKATFDPRVRPTGERLLVSGPAQWVTAPAILAANLPGPRAFMRGQTALQQSLRSGAAADAMGNAVAGGSAPLVGSTARAAMGQQPSTGDFVEGLATSNPEALGPYADVLQRAAAEGNLSLVHWSLQQKDPQYRAMIEALRKEQPQ